jgi:lysophospholipase L1-like esterase
MKPFALIAAAWICALAAPAAMADPAVTGYPNSIASTGDSITRAFNTCLFPFIDCPPNSWSTGTSATVNSHYRRILAVNPAVYGRNFNDAKTGAKMAGLQAQVQTAVAQRPEYVTVLMGANDVCTSSESTMTSVDTLRSQFQSALTTLTVGLPNTRVYVVSIPDVYHLWEILHTNLNAVLTWTIGGICQSLLANPMSTSSADTARRLRVRQRAIDDNNAIAGVCAAFIHCRYDNGAAFALQFARSDVSTRDYFHPSVAGQAKAAGVTWAAGFDFTDGIAPVSAATTAPDPAGGTEVTL